VQNAEPVVSADSKSLAAFAVSELCVSYFFEKENQR
jgi:hypothetical protein